MKEINLEKSYLGIELGSTRIKAVLIDGNSFDMLASSSYKWENQYIDGVWTYSIGDVKIGLRNCFAELKHDFISKYGFPLKNIGCIGISGMMHGYLAFDKNDELSVPFRTWRNTITEKASAELSELFDFNIPQRWSVAHFYQSLLNNEPHVQKVSKLNTLSGYVHYLLTGEYVLGMCDASGMFPIDVSEGSFDKTMLKKFNAKLKEHGLNTDFQALLPKPLKAGEYAGRLTKEGSLLLDPEGELSEGIKFCPPEGDAGTGMVATNSITPRAGNVSAGTSIFAMIVLENKLSKSHREIDIVTTPEGKPVAMVQCNNCTSEINAWHNIFKSFAKVIGKDIEDGELFDILFNSAVNGASDCGNLCSYNYLSGEHITKIEKGAPMFFRTPNSDFSFENFIRVQLYSSVATLRLGFDILFENENVVIDRIVAHGGFFKTKNVGQSILAAALDTEISVYETASEGGSYGMALLAAYTDYNNISLCNFLNKVFKNYSISTVKPEAEQVKGYNRFLDLYKNNLTAEKAIRFGE